MNTYAISRTVAQVATSMSLGDVVCQILEKKTVDTTHPSDYCSLVDLNRTSTMASCAILVSGPWAHCQYWLLEKLFAGNSTQSVVKKVLFSACQAPISIALTFSTIQLLQGNGLAGAKKKVLADVPSTWLAGTIVWPAIMGMNFKYVPINHRPLVGAVAGSFWNVYIAYQANKKADGGDKVRLIEEAAQENGVVGVLKRAASRLV